MVELSIGNWRRRLGIGHGRAVTRMMMTSGVGGGGSDGKSGDRDAGDEGSDDHGRSPNLH